MIPEGWRKCKLGEVTDFKKGRMVENAEILLDGYIPYIGAVTFSGNGKLYCKPDDAILCDEDDILILWDGERSGLTAIGLKGAVSSTVVRLRPHSNIMPQYLFQFINNKYDWIQSQRTGNAIPHVPKNLKDILEILVPPLPEQKRIAEVLGSVDNAIEATKAVITQTKKLKQGLLQTLLTKGIGHTKFKDSPLGDIPESWEVVKLENLGNGNRPVIKAGPFGSSLKKEFYVEKGYKIYGQEQVIAGDLSIGDYYINQKKFDELKSCEVQSGDILVSLVGTLGKVVIVPNEFERGIINPRLVRISVNKNKMTSEFLAHWLSSEYVVSHLDKSSHGGTMGVINGSILKALLVPLPPLPEQKAIAEIFEGMDNHLTAETAKLASLQQLKKGLMHDLLTGKVRVA